jgi:hypothetical protein
MTANAFVFTIEIGGTPTLTFEAQNLREAHELCHEQWLKDDLAEAKSDSVPLWDGKAKLRARIALPEESVLFAEAKNNGQEIKAMGQMTRNPWKEAFLSSNIKYILIATVVLIGQGVVWYSGQFWALYFLQQVSKVDSLTSAYIVGAALLIATPSLIFFGWLSDQIGRKPVILGGMLFA